MKRVENDTSGGCQFECRCKCGKFVVCRGGNLRKGTRSCGCLEKELKTVHGLTGTRVYMAWKRITGRCYNPNNSDFSYYGGRGIRMCESIRASAVNLFALIGDCPEGLTIDRINNDLHYCCGACAECQNNSWPMNLRWATREVQAHNMRSNRFITIGHETKCLSEWARIRGVHRTTIASRLNRGIVGDALFV